MDHAPTARQRAVLLTIRTHIAEKGYPPTQRELSDKLGYSSTNAARDHVIACERLGLLVVAPRVSRGLRITPAGNAVLDTAAPEDRGRE
jgi:repressor LexA